MIEPHRRQVLRGIVSAGGLMAVCPLLFRSSAHAQERWLITPEEREASASAAKRGTRGFAVEDTKGDDPTVEILAPRQDERIVAPVDFNVRFYTRPPASIVLRSIKILYGSLGINITSRIVQYGGQITAEGITLNKAPLQPDTYRITVEVANTERRVARKTVQFQVE